MGAKITDVMPESIAALQGIRPGDELLAINGVPLIDLVDYLMLGANEQVLLSVRQDNGVVREISLKKDAWETLGLGFSSALFNGMRQCTNHCLFCFVHQLPPGQRKSLYVRDDDYRMSFLEGSYITLTNLTEEDWERIIRYRLSPLYLSVHAVNPEVRRKLFGSGAAGDVLNQLRRLQDAGITVHTQAVLCPGINDGPILKETIRELAAFWPEVGSLAVVPVGLTGFRRGLYPLRPFERDEAKQVLTMVHENQKTLFDRLGSRFVFAADEWYLLAEEPLPPEEEYEDFPQLDNGVGLIRRFLTELEEALRDHRKTVKKLTGHYVVITGKSARTLWQEAKVYLKEFSPHLRVEILPVENGFLGTTVTVTGLLAGQDIIKAIREHEPKIHAPVYLIPEIMLRENGAEELFLDSVPLQELKEKCAPNRVEVVPTRASDWIDWLNEFSLKGV